MINVAVITFAGMAECVVSLQTEFRNEMGPRFR